MPRPSRVGAALLALACLFPACQQRPGLSDFEGTAWTLATYRDANGLLVEEAYGTLAFTASRASASSCNDCGLAYEAEDNVLRFGAASCTERACVSARSFEIGAVLGGLATSRYFLDSNLLILTGRDGAELVFRGLDPTDSSPPAPQ